MNKFVTGLIVGSLATGLIAWFLQTERGEALQKEIKDSVDDAVDGVKVTADNITSKVKKTVEAGNSVVKSAKNKLAKSE